MNEASVDPAEEQHEEFTTFVIKASAARLKEGGAPALTRARAKPGRPTKGER